MKFFEKYPVSMLLLKENLSHAMKAITQIMMVLGSHDNKMIAALAVLHTQSRRFELCKHESKDKDYMAVRGTFPDRHLHSRRKVLITLKINMTPCASNECC